ncbi:MAG: hypothetical protein M3132_04015 [Actinomycetia bacterium]|nr:hypothetical protein [Actinomycetes bacterium]
MLLGIVGVLGIATLIVLLILKLLARRGWLYLDREEPEDRQQTADDR